MVLGFCVVLVLGIGIVKMFTKLLVLVLLRRFPKVLVLLLGRKLWLLISVMSGYMTLVKKYAYFVSDHRKYYENKEPALAGDFFSIVEGFLVLH